MKTLSLNQMEKTQGGGCLAFLGGLLGMALAGPTPAIGVGLLVALDNADSCAEEGWLF